MDPSAQLLFEPKESCILCDLCVWKPWCCTSLLLGVLPLFPALGRYKWLHSDVPATPAWVSAVSSMGKPSLSVPGRDGIATLFLQSLSREEFDYNISSVGCKTVERASCD